MSTSKIPKPSFVVCIQNHDYPASLERHKIYQRIPDEGAERDGDMRIIAESGEDHLYPDEWFVPSDVPQDAERSLAQSV